MNIGHDAAMKATIAAMDGHRATVQQKLMLEPRAAPPVELEDETVEDESNLQEMEDENVAHPDMVIDAIIDHTPATPIDVDRVSENEDTTQDEDGDVAITQSAKDAECVAMRPMPPPPPRPPRSNIYEASTIILESVQAPTVVTATVEPDTVVQQDSAAPKPSSSPEMQPNPPPPTPPMDESERETLLRQLDLLRLKFKQSVIPTRVYCNVCMPWHHRTLKPKPHLRCDSWWNGTSRISSGRGTSPCTAHTSSSQTVC